jgi:AcrR family transcriptional regulator
MDIDLKQTLKSDLFGQSLSKSQKTRIRIIEGAIKCFVKFGVDKASYQRIAKASGCSYALAKHYFPDRDQLFDATARYIRVRFQELAINALESQTNPAEQLKSYVTSTFDWVRLFPQHAQVWMLFFFVCGTQKSYRVLNTEVVKMGHERIIALLRKGKKEDGFKYDNENAAAKAVQLAITGAVVTLITEEAEDLAGLRRDVIRLCLTIVGK